MNLPHSFFIIRGMVFAALLLSSCCSLCPSKHDLPATASCLGIHQVSPPTAAGAPMVPAGAKISCENIKDLTLPDSTITKSELIHSGWQVPLSGNEPYPPDFQLIVNSDFCRVVGTIAPSIHFEVWLPLDTNDHPWNGKFLGVGNVGLAGFISYDHMKNMVKLGYATASSDTGHQADPAEGAWMRNAPQQREDFSSRSTHVMTINAKAIIQAYYGKPSAYSYFTGCSGGGQQGLMEAQRYPADYNGIVAGAPVYYRTRTWPSEIWPPFVIRRSPENALPPEKLAAIHRAVLSACDVNDGLVDGVINDPASCTFDPLTMLCQDAANSDCLTKEEANSLSLIYDGLRDPSTGELFWPGLTRGSELGWTEGNGLLPEPLAVPHAYLKYVVFAEQPDWDWRSLNFTDPRDFAILRKADAMHGNTLNANSPDLTEFINRGGKLIMYHGWADQQIAPQGSVNYYKEVVAFMGDEAKVQQSLRLFMIPGMAHCTGGEGPGLFNTSAAIEAWVEKGLPPAQVHNPAGTRLLCTYPQVAVYRGSGDTNDVTNFRCKNP